MFQFPGFAPTIVGTGSSIQWVPPFGDARINSCLQIPEPYRSLPRPSSPPDSLGILRSLLSSFADFASSFSQSPRQAPPAVLTTRRLLRSSSFAFLELGKNLTQTFVNHKYYLFALAY